MWSARGALLGLLLSILGSSEVRCECVNMTALSAQLDALLAEYDREAAPGARVPVAAALDVRHAALSPRASTARLLADLHLNWEDKRLTWNATEWRCSSALVSAERLWVPDVGVLSAATLGAQDEGGLRARLASDGRLHWVRRLDLSAPLALDLADWPRDRQTLSVKFGSRSHTDDELELSLTDLEHATVFESGAWELVRVAGGEALWAGGGLRRRVLTWSVTLRRRAPAHAFAGGTVLLTSAALLLAAALLPPADRTPLCAAAAATSTLWLMSALGGAEGGGAVPRALGAAGAAGALGSAAAVCGALVVRLARCRSPPPHALRSLVTAASSFIELTPPEGSAEEVSAWAAAARLLDVALRAALLFAMFVLLCVYYA